MRDAKMDQSASRVVETPKQTTLSYLLLAVVAAILAWSYEQQDGGEPDHRRTESHVTQAKTPSSLARRALGDNRAIFSVDDYPAEAQRRGEEGTVQAEMTVNASGKVARCMVLHSSGFPILDRATCDIFRKRARFVPARDRNGQPVADKVVSPPVVWRLAS